MEYTNNEDVETWLAMRMSDIGCPKQNLCSGSSGAIHNGVEMALNDFLGGIKIKNLAMQWHCYLPTHMSMTLPSICMIFDSLTPLMLSSIYYESKDVRLLPSLRVYVLACADLRSALRSSRTSQKTR